MHIQGYTAPGFEVVREELVGFLNGQSDDPGVQLAVYSHGRRVVDLWSDSMTPDTLVPLYSVTKGAAALTVALLVQEGILSLDEQHATLPFRITLREVLGHRAGLIGVRDGFSVEELEDDQRIAARLRHEEPFWEPGSAYGYHVLVFGALLDDHVRAVTGRGLGEHFAERVAAPYALDFHLGLTEEDESRFVPALPSADPPGPGLEPGTLPYYATNGGTDLLAMMKRRSARAHGQLSFGGIGSARGVARLYAAAVSTVDGLPPLLTDETTTEFSWPYSLGPDLILGVTDHYALGFETIRTYLPSAQERAFGHKGATGSLGWCDSDSGIAYGYVRRQFDFPAPENVALSTAVMEAAEAVARTSRPDVM